MPIYEYRCPDCEHEFDVLQDFSEPPITLCPKCAMNNVGKLISTPSFSLKGQGWFNDHYGLKKSTDTENQISEASSSVDTIDQPLSVDEVSSSESASTSNDEE